MNTPHSTIDYIRDACTIARRGGDHAAADNLAAIATALAADQQTPRETIRRALHDAHAYHALARAFHDITT